MLINRRKKQNTFLLCKGIHTHLEPGALTSPGLLLDGHDLQHLVFKTRTQEEVDDLRLLQEKE